MDWTQIVVTIIGMFGVIDLGRLLFFKSSKKKANAEADSAAVEPLKNAIEILNAQLLDANTKISNKDEKIASLAAEVTALKLERVTTCTAMCVHYGCKLRAPLRGQGLHWLEEHGEEPDLGGDFCSVESLLKRWRADELARNKQSADAAGTSEEV